MKREVLEMSTEREFGWDDVIEKDGDEFVVLPAGDYDFEITGFERGRHEGSEKLPPCNKAMLSIKIVSGADVTTIKHNLFLHSKTEGLLCAFFTSIGQRKKGEKLQMNWNNVIGSRGRCKLTVREYTAENGEKRQSNQINKFYEPKESNQWEAGSF